MDTADTLLHDTAPAGPLPPRDIAGFLVRLVAFLLDSIIIGAVGLVLGSVFFDFFAGLGFLGKLIGFAVALPYFALLNSSIGNGQTLGKRALGLQVPWPGWAYHLVTAFCLALRNFRRAVLSQWLAGQRWGRIWAA